jgi:hypothetical protein
MAVRQFRDRRPKSQGRGLKVRNYRNSEQIRVDRFVPVRFTRLTNQGLESHVSRKRA